MAQRVWRRVGKQTDLRFRSASTHLWALRVDPSLHSQSKSQMARICSGSDTAALGIAPLPFHPPPPLVLSPPPYPPPHPPPPPPAISAVANTSAGTKQIKRNKLPVTECQPCKSKEPACLEKTGWEPLDTLLIPLCPGFGWCCQLRRVQAGTGESGKGPKNVGEGVRLASWTWLP